MDRFLHAAWRRRSWLAVAAATSFAVGAPAASGADVGASGSPATYVLRGTLAQYIAPSSSVVGSVTIAVSSANRQRDALVGMRLTVAIDRSTKIRGAIRAGVPGEVVVRGPADEPEALRGMTAMQLGVAGSHGSAAKKKAKGKGGGKSSGGDKSSGEKGSGDKSAGGSGDKGSGGSGDKGGSGGDSGDKGGSGGDSGDKGSGGSGGDKGGSGDKGESGGDKGSGGDSGDKGGDGGSGGGKGSGDAGGGDQGSGDKGSGGGSGSNH